MSKEEVSAIFATIGPAMEDGADPLHRTLDLYSCTIVYCIASDEPPHKTRGSTESNIVKFEKLYNRNIFRLVEFSAPDVEENIIDLAAHIIDELKRAPKKRLIIDPSAGRTALSYTLITAGQLATTIVRDYHKIRINGITCVINPKGQDTIIFPFHYFSIPNEAELSLLEQDLSLNQEELAKSYNKSQSTISIRLSQLERMGYITVQGQQRELTYLGENIKRLLSIK